MIRRRPGPLTTEQAQLWEAFLASYQATATRPAVDMFLHALIGAPAKPL